MGKSRAFDAQILKIDDLIRGVKTLRHKTKAQQEYQDAVWQVIKDNLDAGSFRKIYDAGYEKGWRDGQVELDEETTKDQL